LDWILIKVLLGLNKWNITNLNILISRHTSQWDPQIWGLLKINFLIIAKTSNKIRPAIIWNFRINITAFSIFMITHSQWKIWCVSFTSKENVTKVKIASFTILSWSPNHNSLEWTPRKIFTIIAKGSEILEAIVFINKVKRSFTIIKSINYKWKNRIQAINVNVCTDLIVIRKTFVNFNTQNNNNQCNIKKLIRGLWNNKNQKCIRKWVKKNSFLRKTQRMLQQIRKF